MPKNNPQIFTSEKKNWRTPKTLFYNLDEQFRFWIDLAADNENFLCSNFLTEEKDALKQDWIGLARSAQMTSRYAWCNPPYGRGLVKWIKKAYEENLKGFKSVWLIPARTDTQFFHKFIFGKAKRVAFIKSRIKFVNEFGQVLSGATFPSMVVEFCGHPVRETEFITMDVNGKVI